MIMSLPGFLTDAFFCPTRLQRLQGEPWNQRGIRVYMKREDERDALLGGNKWCKLAGHLALAEKQGLSRLLSVGGIWSNHLHALAHAGQRFGLETVGIVRGDASPLTPMLHEALAAGMQLEFVSRQNYRSRHESEWQRHFSEKFGPCLMIPEGGAGQPAMAGLARLAEEIAAQMSGPLVLAVPAGSGTTLTGLCASLPERFTVWGFQAFADKRLATRIHESLPQTGSAPWSIFTTQSMRAHRELPAALADFMSAFGKTEGIPLDSLYTVRMMARLQALIADGRVPDNGTVVALHTGGLQGRRGHHQPQFLECAA